MEKEIKKRREYYRHYEITIQRIDEEKETMNGVPSVYYSRVYEVQSMPNDHIAFFPKKAIYFPFLFFSPSLAFFEY